MTIEIQTSCAHCDQPLLITLDSQMNFQVHNAGADPFIFEPNVNWAEFSEPNIIDAY